MTIPVLICPVLNEPERVDAMLDSVDHPIDKVLVIDNGDVCEDVRTDAYRVIKPGHNLGVAASWNLGIKCSPLAPWWLIVNHDITFGAGDLDRLVEKVEPRAGAVYYLLGMAAFAVTPPTIATVGLFDESFVLGYDEDIDWQRRLRLAGIVEVEVGFTGTHVGSATIYADPELRRWNAMSHPRNDSYFRRKWGGEKGGGETFTTPFNRGGGVDEWTLEFDRLREQTWPRK